MMTKEQLVTLIAAILSARAADTKVSDEAIKFALDLVNRVQAMGIT